MTNYDNRNDDEYADDDINFEEYTTTSEFETVPTGAYVFEFIDFHKNKKKSERKMNSDLALAQRNDPTTTMADIDEYQWQFDFKIVGGEYDGITLVERVTRKLHENSNAGKIVAALLGVDKYDLSVARQFGSMRALFGKRLQAYIEETESNGKTYNNFSKFSKVPEPRKRRQATGEAVRSVQLDGYPTPGGDEADDFNDGVPASAPTPTPIKAATAARGAHKGSGPIFPDDDDNI